MDVYQKQDRCCLHEYNIIEVDGTHVCTVCAKVADMISFGGCHNSSTFTTINSILHELCHSLHMDTCTDNIANEIYSNVIMNHRTLHKRILFPTSIYIAAKRNSVPRTLKEVSGGNRSAKQRNWLILKGYL